MSTANQKPDQDTQEPREPLAPDFILYGIPGPAAYGFRTSDRRRWLFGIYFADLRVAKRAAIKAGYSESVAWSQVKRMLEDGRVQAVIRDRETAVLKDYELEGPKLLHKLGVIANASIRDYIDEQGRIRDVHDIPDAVARAIAGYEEEVKTETDKDGNSYVTVKKKLKWPDRNKAADMLMKHRGMYEKDNSQQGAAQAEALASLMERVQASSSIAPVSEREQ